MTEKVVSLDSARKDRDTEAPPERLVLDLWKLPRMQCPCSSTSFVMIPTKFLGEVVPDIDPGGIAVACQACGTVAFFMCAPLEDDE